MKWDFAIGNPAYQETQDATSDKPVYNYFMDEAQKIADKVEMITPARFLFNAGKTPKEWNEKKLNDEHFKVLMYESDAAKIFPNTEIKGGVTVTYRDATKKYNPIIIYTKYPELNSILHRVTQISSESISEIVYLQNKFNLEKLYESLPEVKSQIGSNGRERRLTTSIFSTTGIFFDTPNNSTARILGLIKNGRVYKYIDKGYLSPHENLDKYKIVLPKVNGTGQFGETLSSPMILEPGTGFTQSFISIGAFTEKTDAVAALNYVKSKFARTMLNILKITQDNNSDVWKYVPLQDFTDKSDIDWNTSIANIDKQLYKKYGLSREEIDFIETHVKEMA